MWKRLDSNEPADTINSAESVEQKDPENLSTKAIPASEPPPPVIDNLRSKVKRPVRRRDVKPGKKPYDKPSTTDKKEEGGLWDPSHFRLFVGNLGTTVTTEELKSAFSSFKSLSNARVISNPKTPGENKGYGFVAFSDPQDYLRAFQSMNNKYIGPQPVVLKKAKPIATSPSALRTDQRP